MKPTWENPRRELTVAKRKDKAIVAVAAQKRGPAIGRIRLRQIYDASAGSLTAFIQESIAPGSVVHTDGWMGYVGLEKLGYRHKVTILSRSRRNPHQLMPRVHRVASLLKRWLLGTHQGGVQAQHLEYYLDEFNLPFQPPRLSFPWPALLPSCRTSRGHRTGSVPELGGRIRPARPQAIVGT